MRRFAMLVSCLVLVGCVPPQGAAPPSPGPTAPPVGLPGNGDLSPTPAPSEAPFEVVRITPQEVKARMDAGEPVLLADVRPRSSYDHLRIQGAESMPLGDIATWGPTLTKEQLVVFY